MEGSPAAECPGADHSDVRYALCQRKSISASVILTGAVFQAEGSISRLIDRQELKLKPCLGMLPLLDTTAPRS